MALTLFLLSVAFCAYTYFVFPLLLHWRAGRGATQVDAASRVDDSSLQGSSWPSVTILIAVHNERHHLERKLQSLAKLDYPHEQLEIIIVSDGSSDGSEAYLQQMSTSVDAEIAGLMSRVVVEHYDTPAGKPTALNIACGRARHDVLVYMDARQTVSENAIKALVTRLQQPGVGVVSGELVLSDDGHTEAANVGLYWRYEKWIRLNESTLFSTTGATGALYAIRRQDATLLPADTLLDDFITPVEILRQGKRTVFEPSARVFDASEKDADKEYRRKVRTLAGNFQAFSRQPWLFNPRKNPVWWQFLSHKVARLLVPYAMAIAFCASLFGSGWFLNSMLLLQLVFYAVGIVGTYSAAFGQQRIVSFIKVFLQLNLAAVVGAIRYFTGTAAIRWKS